MSTTVTSKGQVTIPKNVRDRMGLEAGSQVEFVPSQNGEYVLRRADAKKQLNPNFRERIKHLIGSRPSDMSTDEIMELLRGKD